VGRRIRIRMLGGKLLRSRREGLRNLVEWDGDGVDFLENDVEFLVGFGRGAVEWRAKRHRMPDLVRMSVEVDPSEMGRGEIGVNWVISQVNTPLLQLVGRVYDLRLEAG
jgi:hypothetical protein